MRKSGGSSTKGFSIIELIITLGVASMFLFGAYVLMINAIDSSRRSRNRTTASNLALRKVEQLRQSDFDDIPICDGAPDPAECTETPSPILGITYTIYIDSAEHSITLPPPGDDTSRRKDITVRVEWRDPKPQAFVTETSVTPYTLLRTPGA